MMHRKDFEFIAHKVKYDRNISTYLSNVIGCLLAIWFEKEYPHFDKQKFLRACNVSEETFEEIVSNDTDHPV